MTTSSADSPLVEVSRVKKYFPVTSGIVFKKRIGEVKAVDDVSLTIQRGETLGLVGESGSGKSTLGRCILQLHQQTEGEVKFDGVEMSTLGGRELRTMRRRINAIFQDPYSSLSPRMTAAGIIGEPVSVHGLVASKAEMRDRIQGLLETVGLNPYMADRFPHEFSGGQRQRIAIARAMALKPRFVVLDEPTSALDKTVQAQIVELLLQLQERHGLAYLFISHDLKVVRALASELIVMKEGLVVEQGPTREIFAAPQETYTRALIAAAFDIEAIEDGEDE